MTQECCMIIMDSSDCSRNGDALPSRFQSQLDTVSAIIRTKFNQNPQNCVGLMTMGGNQCQLLSTPVTHSGSLYSKFSSIEIGGEINFAAAI
jgi:26S proteasome regulatory subunit N10